MELLIEKTLKVFLRGEVQAAALLFFMSFVAIVLVNSQWEGAYSAFVNLPISLKAGDFELNKPLFVWVNELLMALFFLLVTLEIKREFLVGHLSKGGFSDILLPAIAAVAGMVVPALIYVLIAEPEDFSGWAIPAATDIAFSLGVIALLGNRVPQVARLFMMAVAVFDDLGAIAIIAAFYSESIIMIYLGLAAIAIAILLILNRLSVYSLYPYMIVGAFLWWSILKSGFHATLSGVIVALFVPCLTQKKCTEKDITNPTEDLEIALTPLVNFFVLPLFALVNVYLPFSQLGGSSLVDSLTLAIALGLILGKPIGIFGSVYLMVKFGMAKLPQGLNFKNLLGVSAVCGMGFTMSLFIGRLAFDDASGNPKVILGVILGSLVSAVFGMVVLWIGSVYDRRKAGSLQKDPD